MGISQQDRGLLGFYNKSWANDPLSTEVDFIKVSLRGRLAKILDFLRELTYYLNKLLCKKIGELNRKFLKEYIYQKSDNRRGIGVKRYEKDFIRWRVGGVALQ